MASLRFPLSRMRMLTDLFWCHESHCILLWLSQGFSAFSTLTTVFSFPTIRVCWNKRVSKWKRSWKEASWARYHLQVQWLAHLGPVRPKAVAGVVGQFHGSKNSEYLSQHGVANYWCEFRFFLCHIFASTNFQTMCDSWISWCASCFQIIGGPVIRQLD